MKLFVFLVIFCAVALCQVDVRPSLDGKIVGGKRVSIDKFPYQASVRIENQHICGGTIIDQSTVLTAAHCVYGMDHSQYTVRVGSTYHSLGRSVRVAQIRQHALYDPNRYNFDMAILKLASPMTFSKSIQPIPLQPPGVELPSGTNAWVSGWGTLYEGSEQVSDELRAVDVAVLTNFECSKNYKPGEISSHMLCAQTYNQDSCQGDSGGPLVANGILIGVVSWGYGCARPEYPGVYSKVSNLYNWIISNK